MKKKYTIKKAGKEPVVVEEEDVESTN